MPEKDTITANTPTTMNKGSRRRWIIPLVVLLAALAVGIGIAGVFLSGRADPEVMDPAVQLLVDNGTLVDTEPDDLWKSEPYVKESGSNFTPRAMLGADMDSIGVLTIEKIGVSVQVYDSENTMEDMKKGASHYRISSYWDGNICMAAHIGNASYSYFGRLRELKVGDIIQYETTLGIRTYTVDDIRTITDEDWSVIERTGENRITLTTCVAGKDNMRLCVRAIEAA